MSDSQLFIAISMLPDDLKKEVKDFVDLLNQKSKQKPRKNRISGIAKGIVKMRDNFDDPIPGFEEYLP